MTSDFGATWREIVDGLPADVPSRVVREDPVRPDLLYAGTQLGAFVSFDRGGRWQPLNNPAGFSMEQHPLGTDPIAEQVANIQLPDMLGTDG